MPDINRKNMYKKQTHHYQEEYKVKVINNILAKKNDLP